MAMTLDPDKLANAWFKQLAPLSGSRIWFGIKKVNGQPVAGYGTYVGTDEVRHNFRTITKLLPTDSCWNCYGTKRNGL